MIYSRGIIMNWDFSKMAELFSKDGNSKLLVEGNFGVEIESARITSSGDLALTPHPLVFGDKAENQRITTDFSESQIEMITPPLKSVEEVFKSIKEIRTEVENGMKDELLWPSSMPPRLPDEEHIPIAKFSDSKEGQEKEVYRKGLALRYGKKMQMISGIHYNFSFSEEMIDFLYEQFEIAKSKRAFIDDMYLSLTRNFLRYRWVLIYIFGGSPFCDPSYYSVIYKELKVVKKCCQGCCDAAEKFDEFATSLRVSRFGYSNTIQRKYNVYFNSMEEYTKKLRKKLVTVNTKYLKLGLYKNNEQIQLNGNVLQKESEFYSSIRLKQNISKGETQLDALSKRGVKYLEIRILDINPFEKLGMSLEQLYFLQVFMLFCLFEESDNITSSEFKKINTNHHLTALFGRKEGLMLHSYQGGKISLKAFGEKIFEKLRNIAKLMDNGAIDCKYSESVEQEYKKLMDISLLPSEKINRYMKENDESFLEFGIRQATTNNSKIF
jgi:glutamate--cysteine ligase